MQDLTKTLAEFDISLLKLQIVIPFINSAIITAARFYGDYKVAECEQVHNRDLANYYKLLSRRIE